MIIKVRVRPGSGMQEIGKICDGEYKVSLKSRAEDNRANLELVKLLRRYFKKEHSFDDIKILKGLKSRDKVIEVK